jgi:ankyrin repeat protein
VQAGATVNTETKPPLIEAAKLGFHTIVKYLLENGADPDIKGNFREIKNSNAYDIANHMRKQSICTIPGFIITMFKCTGSDLDKTCCLLRAAMEKKNNISGNTVDI